MSHLVSVITHRGLDFGAENYYPESSREAFEDQLKRGFSLEFDLQIDQLGEFVISHNLVNSTLGNQPNPDPHLSFIEMIDLINRWANPNVIHAVHVKHFLQTDKWLEKLKVFLHEQSLVQFIFFDLLPKSAAFLKSDLPGINLAASVGHPFDVKRYNQVVGGTLLTVDQVVNCRDLYDWVWLDEWDRLDENGFKKLYTEDVFSQLRLHGFKIGLVSPELHATSPMLLGGEKHQDAKDLPSLKDRLKEIILLRPDLICTDYPDMVKSLVDKILL